jgi:ubiquinone/menaquinone biosynthesis C-methylase UbiE
MVTEQEPDPDSLRYARYWEPVLAAPAQRLLRLLDVVPRTYLDIGAGTGALVLAAARRWPEARLIGLDASAGMLSVARSRSSAGADGAGRFSWLAADAAAMPLDDASVDVATSSFMLQLADDRRAVLGEVKRVLRPGAVFAFVTWLADELELEADEAFEEALAELGLDEAEPPGGRPPRVTDYRSLDEARDELLAAGFTQVEVRVDDIHHAWTREAFLEFKLDFDEYDLVESLEAPLAERLRSAALARFADMPESAFVVRGPLVVALARR